MAYTTMQTLKEDIVKALRARVPILPFHARFLRAAYSEGVDVAALSCPRGSGKTWLLGQLAALALTPGSPTWESGIEVIAVSGSLEQSRVMLQFVRQALLDREGEYRLLDSSQRLTMTHRATGTRLRVLSSSGKRAMGLSQFSSIFADEPGSWESRGGSLMWDALRQSLGKREGQKLILIGTKSPAAPGSWWPDLLDAGSGPGRHVTVLSAPQSAAWDSWAVAQKCNPMLKHNRALARVVRRERDEARRSSTMRRAFEAYRLNRHLDTAHEPLVELPDWRAVLQRPVPPRQGRPVLGADLGAERAWSGATLLWKNGRMECYALCPGVPDLKTRERQDGQPRGLYRQLQHDGSLIVDEGVRVSRPATLIDHLVKIGIRPALCLCDRFLVGSLRDAVRGRWPVIPRTARWSESTEDISAFRQLVKDGPMAVAPESRGLALLALSESSTVSDDMGSTRMTKNRRTRSRDDVAVAAVLATGALARQLRRPRRG